jgi:ketosteroid isomerase-like protein
MAAREVAKSYFDAIARHDLDAIASHYSPELVVDMMGQGIMRGPGEMRAFFDSLFAAIPDAEMITERIVAEERVAVVQWRLRGSFTGAPLFGVDPTGGWIEQRGCDVIEVTEGLITRNTAYQDGIEMLRSFGMMPPLDSPAERAMKQAFNVTTRARKALRERFG